MKWLSKKKTTQETRKRTCFIKFKFFTATKTKSACINFHKSTDAAAGHSNARYSAALGVTAPKKCLHASCRCCNTPFHWPVFAEWPNVRICNNWQQQQQQRRVATYNANTQRKKKHENANNFEKWAQKRGRNNADYCTRSGKLLCLPATGVLCANNMLHMHYCSQTDMQYAPKRLKSLCSLRISSLMHLYLYTFMEPKLWKELKYDRLEFVNLKKVVS